VQPLAQYPTFTSRTLNSGSGTGGVRPGVALSEVGLDERRMPKVFYSPEMGAPNTRLASKVPLKAVSEAVVGFAAAAGALVADAGAVVGAGALVGALHPTRANMAHAPGSHRQKRRITLNTAVIVSFPFGEDGRAQLAEWFFDAPFVPRTMYDGDDGDWPAIDRGLRCRHAHSQRTDQPADCVARCRWFTGEQAGCQTVCEAICQTQPG
jgi:hypothetical protein